MNKITKLFVAVVCARVAVAFSETKGSRFSESARKPPYLRSMACLGVGVRVVFSTVRIGLFIIFISRMGRAILEVFLCVFYTMFLFENIVSRYLK